MAKLDKPLNTFKNFKGLYSRTESGLVPDNSSTGVYASELLNVQMKDGTITWGKGYAPENDGSTDTTFSVTTTDSYIRQAWAFKTMAGGQRKVLWLNDGNLMFYNSVLNKYEVLEPAASMTTDAGSDMGFTVFYRAHADRFERNRAFFGTSAAYAVHTWDAAQANVASYTATTVTKSGSSTWTTEGFEATGTIIVNGIKYTYSGGAGTTTLTGLGTDMTIDSPAVGTGAAQTIDQNDVSLPATVGTNPDIIFVYQGRLGLASTKSSQIMLSVKNNPYDVTTTGTGNAITINIGEGNGPLTALAVYKDNMIACKQDCVLSINVELTASNSEVVRIKPIASRYNIGPKKPDHLAVADDELYYISADKRVKRISNLPQYTANSIQTIDNISTDIEPTLRGLNYDRTRLVYFDKSLLAACSTGSSTNDTVLEFDSLNKTFYLHNKPVTSWFVVGSDLYFGQEFTTGVNKYNDTYDDDTASVTRLWRSGRHNLGEEFRKKATQLFAVHARMSENATFNVQLDYNNLGTLYTLDFDIAGDGSSNDDGLYIVAAPVATSYGTNPYGAVPYGSDTNPDNDEDLVEVIAFKSLPLRYSPYDYTVQFSGTGEGQRVKILAYGLKPEVRQEVPKKALIE